MKGHGSASEPRGTRTSISQGAPLAKARPSAGRSSSGEEARAPETPKASASLGGRVLQVGGDHPAPEALHLVAADIAVAAVVEHERHHADPLLRRRGEVLHPEQEAAVAADRDHRARSGFAALTPSAVRKPEPSVPW